MKKLALLAVFAAAGCRSDGGFDRQDLSHGVGFASARFLDRTAHDANRMLHLASSVPGAVAGSFEHSAENLTDTYRLYLESQTHRVR